MSSAASPGPQHYMPAQASAASSRLLRRCVSSVLPSKQAHRACAASLQCRPSSLCCRASCRASVCVLSGLFEKKEGHQPLSRSQPQLLQWLASHATVLGQPTCPTAISAMQAPTLTQATSACYRVLASQQRAPTFHATKSARLVRQ